MDEEIKRAIVASIPSWVPVLSALGGVIVGALINRKTQYKHWRIQRRADEYAKVLTIFRGCYKDVEAYLASTEILADDFPRRSTRVSTISEPFYNEVRVARLFASKAVKEHLIAFQDKYSKWAHEGAMSVTTNPIQQMQNVVGTITESIGVISFEMKLQDLLEHDLRKL